MKRININSVIAAVMPAAILLLFTACSAGAGKTDGSNGLVNRMTEKELSEAQETEFMLLDHPWEKAEETEDEAGFNEVKEKILFAPGLGSIVYGNPVFNALPPDGYDGGSGQISFMHFDSKTGETAYTEISFDDYEDLKTKIRKEFDKDIAGGYPKVPADEDYRSLISLYDAVISGDAEPLDKKFLDDYMEYYYNGGVSSESDSYYWQMDDEKVRAIKDSIKEYHLYDEELDTGLTVHVTTPAGYDAGRSYPALVMTDAVWRFNDVTALYDLMADGKAEPQILVTIGFEYDTDGWDNVIRGNILCDHKKEFLDFITDNMMPFLDAKYKLDYDRSTLFGHSQGGVFTHYAAFNYDLYENKPFKRYIIGSPTFWTPYFTCVGDYENYRTEYGYFDRHKIYDRELYITAGDKEDEDYADYYGENDSTTEGVRHLEERLAGYGVSTYKVKFYDSHHYQYVPDMLVEYCENM